MRYPLLLSAFLLAMLFSVVSERLALSGIGKTQKQIITPTVKLEKATFAGGCFWCMEHPFDELPGVDSVTSGYTGGQKKNPTYEEVSAGSTGHAESVQVVYDPAKIGYEKLLSVYWRNVDPTVKDRQFCDTGNQYRSAIFYHSEEQRRLAIQSKEALEKNKPFREKIVTEITPASVFYPAEEHHQHYYRKNPIRYNYYRSSCGRDRRLKELWGKPAVESNNGKVRLYSVSAKGYIMSDKVNKTKEEWRKLLTPEQYHVTREKGTERAYTGATWNNHEKGVYQCICCGNDLFSSDHKYESGTGWPSFTQPVAAGNVATKPDNSLFTHRTEVLCSRCDAHLGHLFEDGPKLGGLRYCMNSAAMKFVK